MVYEMDRQNQMYIGALALLVLGLITLSILYYLQAHTLQVERTLSSQELEKASATIEELSALLETKRKESEELAGALSDERNRTTAFSKQIDAIQGTVNTLEKLQQTDPELLQKYSKVYFLSENYVPVALTAIPENYVYPADRELFVHAQVAPFLLDMLSDAQKDGISLSVSSAYRSFAAQTSLKSNYTVTYGTGANRFSADQGYSEHQLGTTLDFIEKDGTLVTFANTKAYEWLLEHAYRYGFVLSYPKENTYYQYEPWHWRFVGTDLARLLHKDHKYLYQLDQRTIDAYLVSLFD